MARLRKRKLLWINLASGIEFGGPAEMNEGDVREYEDRRKEGTALQEQVEEARKVEKNTCDVRGQDVMQMFLLLSGLSWNPCSSETCSDMEEDAPAFRVKKLDENSGPSSNPNPSERCNLLALLCIFSPQHSNVEMLGQPLH
eukprot:749481-Hanusia_phi.AAC.4